MQKITKKVSKDVKNKGGRPRVGAENERTIEIKARVNLAEKARFDAMCKAEGKTGGEIIRGRLGL